MTSSLQSFIELLRNARCLGARRQPMMLWRLWLGLQASILLAVSDGDVRSVAEHLSLPPYSLDTGMNLLDGKTYDLAEIDSLVQDATSETYLKKVRDRVQQNPESMQYTWQLARTLDRQDRRDESKALYERIREQGRQREGSLSITEEIFSIKAWAELGNIREARADLESLVSRHPESWEVQLAKAEFLVFVEQRTRIEPLEDGAEIDPVTALKEMLDDFNEHKKDLQIAYSHLKEALRLGPDQVSVRIAHANFLVYRLFRFLPFINTLSREEAEEIVSDFSGMLTSQAVREMEAALELQPDNVAIEIRTRIFQMFESMALDATDRTPLPQVRPESVRRNLTRLEMKVEQVDAALGVRILEAIAIWSFMMEQDQEWALRSAEHALRKHPTSQVAWEVLLLVSGSREDYRELLALSDRRLQLGPSLEFSLIRAKALARLQEPDRALKIYEAILKDDPSNWQACIGSIVLILQKQNLEPSDMSYLDHLKSSIDRDDLNMSSTEIIQFYLTNLVLMVVLDQMELYPILRKIINRHAREIMASDGTLQDNIPKVLDVLDAAFPMHKPVD